MSKLRVLFILSLVILGMLLVSIFSWTFAGGEQKYSEVQRESLLETKNGWILQLDVVNREGMNKIYTISVAVNDQPSTMTVSVRDGGTFTYIKDIYLNMLDGGQGQVFITVGKEGEDIPLQQGTYYLK